MLASRQLFPIHTVKWRPHDDFLIIGCTDGTVYVWQMETGHLDRVVHGVTAEEILHACEEKLEVEEALVNPTISIAQAFKRHNLATFRNLATQQLKKATDTAQEEGGGHRVHPSLVHRPQVAPMMIHGLRTNIKDSDAHVIYFDTESLIVQLLGEEHAQLSSDALAAMMAGSHDPHGHLSDKQKKLADFITKVKDKAEDVGQKIQAKAESAGFKPISPHLAHKGDGPHGPGVKRPPRPPPPKLGGSSTGTSTPVPQPVNSLVMQVSQLLMSCLHAWGLDPDLDRLARSKLGMLLPKRPISFGLLSRGGHMSLLLPGWQGQVAPVTAQEEVAVQPSDPATHAVMKNATNGHWYISAAVTTHHLLSVISTANTLMSMTNATFIPGRYALLPGSPVSEEGLDQTQQAQTKQGWSLLAALHCVLLPDLLGKQLYWPPQLEMLARRWQDRCLEIREAAQALFLAELRRIGPDGRRKVVEEWSPYLPSYVDPTLSLLTDQQQQQHPGGTTQEEEPDNDDDGMLGGSDSPVHRVSQSFESRRKQATAIVMMGVLGAEFGAAIEMSKGKDAPSSGGAVAAGGKKVVEGFGLTNYSHARHTSKALTFLLLQPATARLPAYTPIRRAAVDLLGRGFTVWEPYLDVSAVLLGLLELCVDGDKLIPSMTFGLPLSPRADACRTARHALALIATARPPACVITLAKEVARYNALAQNAQGQHSHSQLQNSVLVRAKSEILRVIELLIDKIPNEVAELLVEVMDVIVHCLDPAAIKNKGLQETFPMICRFSNVSYCSHSRRICVGAKTGGVAFYELKQSKCQIIPAHKGSVSAVAFSPDGKYLASYSFRDNRILFWQTASTSLFSLGSQQTKCVKNYSTPPLNIPPNTNPLKTVKLVWTDGRSVVLLSADGSESRFRV